MIRYSFTLLILVLLSLNIFAQTKLKVGDKAPDFTAKDQDGKDITLSKYKGKKVILYFYPKDNTPGCTAEACNLRDNNDSLAKAGFVILGVSTDDELSHKDFREKYSLKFTLLTDKDKVVNEKYGVWVEKERDGKKFFGTARTTFIIDEKGVIVQIIDKVDTKQHTQQILRF